MFHAFFTFTWFYVITTSNDKPASERLVEIVGGGGRKFSRSANVVLAVGI